MKLYLVHCGYYDPSICGGTYEFHANYLVAAASFEDARAKAKQLPEVRAKRMHVDGMQEIEAVGGYRIALTPDAALGLGETRVNVHLNRELAPKPQAGVAPSN